MSDLLARFESLLGEVREAGAAAELLPELRRLLEGLEVEAAGASGEAAEGAGEPVPVRFGMVGDSPAMKALYAMMEKVCGSNVPVLIQGETGTGKELVARALHEYGPRKAKRFLAENCAAVSPNLLESELFGHVRGAFTGAVADRAGHFVAADGGTVFLDEIGDMPLPMQSKLLRVLQEGEVRPVGSNKTLTVDVRIIGASNKDLSAMVAAGEFREDLYFRLNVITLQLPPLREREGDVAHLVRFYLGRVAEEMGRPCPALGPGVVEALAGWRWPGNVRELENEIRRAVALSSGTIGLGDLSLSLIHI